MRLTEIALVGGILAILTLAHFIADWVFQSHDEAMRKATEPKIRARHCLVYTGIMSFVLVFGLHLSALEIGVYASILFLSHFVEDSYLPVYLWAKYIRNAPEFTIGGEVSELDRFREFASTPLGKILVIVVDQVIHIIFLAIIAAMMLVHGTKDFWLLYFAALGVIGLFALLSWRAKPALSPVQNEPS